MSVARGFPNAGHFYSNIVKPIKIDCNFIVDSTNGNGLGIRSLKSNGYIRNVFMNTSAAFTGTSHTSTLIDSISDTSALKAGMPVQGSGIPINTTIATVVNSTSITLSAATTSSTTGSITYGGFNDGAGNPNPAAGYALIQMKQNFNYYLGGFSGFVSPASGSSILVTTGVTIGLAYVITIVGSTSLAQWQKLGLPKGVTPAVGAFFIATATTTATGTGAIQVPATAGSGISAVDVVGDPNTMISNSSISTYGGAYVLVRFMQSSNTAVTSVLTMASYTPAGTITNGSPDTFAGTPAVLTGTIANSGGVASLSKAAPAAGSVVSMSFLFDGSSVTVDGL